MYLPKNPEEIMDYINYWDEVCGEEELEKPKRKYQKYGQGEWW